MSQIFSFFSSTRNLLTKNCIGNISQIELNVLPIYLKMLLIMHLISLFCICSLSKILLGMSNAPAKMFVSSNGVAGWEIQDCSVRCSRASIFANMSSLDMSMANAPTLLVCILTEMLRTSLWKSRCSRSITNLRTVRLWSSRFSKDYWRALNVEYEEMLKTRWRNIEENVANVNCAPTIPAKREKQTRNMLHDTGAFFRAAQVILLPRILLFYLNDTMNWQRHKEMWKRLWCVRLRTTKCAVFYDAQYECGVLQRKDAQIKKFQYQRETIISRERPTSRERPPSRGRHQHQERQKLRPEI